ncbi:MAG: preprotein translocase subunit YajC [Spirochaetales bacterium]|nr:preprotein translocase subunit YajC [Spirochaetales bacterium]
MYQLFSLPLLQATAATGSSAMSIVMLVSIFAIFYFLLIRPQRKKEKERQAMIDAVKKGDNVTTIGGIKGTVTNIDNDKATVTIKVDDNCKIKFTKSSVSSVDKDDVKGDDKTAVESNGGGDKKKK